MRITVTRCAWHRLYFGRPKLLRVVVRRWRWGLQFSDGLCKRCADRARAEWGVKRGAKAVVLLALLLTGCAPHPVHWTPYDPAGEWACEQEAWSRSMWAWIDDRYIDRDVFEACMEAKGFKRIGGAL